MKEKLRIVISCGPTREPLDPVRFISNYSTGTLGLTLAKVCERRGHSVTLAHGPVEIPKGLKARLVPFETVLDLKRVLSKEVPRCDVLFMVAAVSDFKPLETAAAKIKKGGGRFFNLSLVENPDILKSLSRLKPGKVYIGFSLESKGVFEHSLKKLRAKNLDLIVAQLVNEKVRPFGKTSIGAIIIDKRGGQKAFRSISKKDLAEYLVDKAEELRRSVSLYGNGQKR